MSIKTYYKYPPKLTAVRRLLSSLYVLESYRLVLLQRQPEIYPVSSILESPSSPFASSEITSSENEHAIDPSALLRCLLSPHLSHPGSTKILEWLFCLTSLTLLSWHTKPYTSMKNPLYSLLRRELIELALYRWHDMITKCLGEVDAWMTLLYHNILMDLYTPVKLIHSLARTSVESSSCVQEPRQSLRAWLKGEDSAKALWHANVILTLSKSKTVLRTDHVSDEPTTSAKRKPCLPEAPHVPISIYVATLTVWANSVCQEPADLSTGQFALESGISILTCLSVRTAQQMVHVLRRLAQRQF